MSLIQIPNVQGNVRYPFTDSSTMTSLDGTVFDDDLFVDARLYPAGGTAGQFVSAISIDHTQAVITVSDDNGMLCSGVVTADSTQVLLTDSLGRPGGIFIGNLNHLVASNVLPVGTYEFAPAAMQFVATCVQPQPLVALEGIVLDTGELFTGDVWLVGGPGVVITGSGQAMTLNGVGDPLSARRACNAAGQPAPAGIPLQALNINGTLVHADQYGNVQLTTGSGKASDNILRVEPVAYGIRLHALGSIS